LHPFGEVPGNTANVMFGASPLALALGFYEVAITVFLPLEGISVADVGVLLTVLGLTTVIFSIPFAVLSDRYGRKHIMIAGSLVASAFILAPGITTNVFLIDLSAVAGGLGEAMFLSTWNAYLADTTTADARAATFSLSFMTFTIASGVGTFIPGLYPLVPADLLTAHRLTFILLAMACLATPLSVSRWAVNMKPTFSRRGILPRKSLGIIAKFSAANLMIGLGAGLIIPLIPTWFFLRFHITDVFSGPLVAASNIMMGLTALGAPSVAKRIGLVRGIVVTQGLSTIFLLSIPLSPSPIVAGPLYVIRAVLMNMSSPLGDTFLMSKIAEDERAIASSFNVIIWRLPNAASTVIGGSLLNSGNLSLPFYLCTILYVTSITLFYALFRKESQNTTTNSN
jgi:MFS family permease